MLKLFRIPERKLHCSVIFTSCMNLHLFLSTLLNSAMPIQEELAALSCQRLYRLQLVRSGGSARRGGVTFDRSQGQTVVTGTTSDSETPLTFPARALSAAGRSKTCIRKCKLKHVVSQSSRRMNFLHRYPEKL